MSKLIELIEALAFSFKSQKQIDEAYLAQSCDIYDLERRMHEMDSGTRNASRLWAFTVTSA